MSILNEHAQSTGYGQAAEITQLKGMNLELTQRFLYPA